MSITRIYLTGGLTVEHDADVLPTATVAGRQHQLVLAALTWRPGVRVERAALARALWTDDPPRSADTAIATVISSLRRTLERTELRIDSAFAAYVLTRDDGTPPWVDVDRARRALHTAEGALRARRMREVYAPSGVVTSICRRTLLAGLEGPWVLDRRTELRELRLRGLRCASEFCSWNGEHQAAIAHARVMVDLDPLREPSHRTLMRAQVAAGDRASALRTFDDVRRLLASELGVDPDDRTFALHRSLLC